MKKISIVSVIKRVNRNNSMGMNLCTRKVKDKTKYTRKIKHRGLSW